MRALTRGGRSLALLVACAGSTRCARVRTAISGDAPPLETSSFVADYDSARVLVVSLQGTIARYPDRLLVVVTQATIPPMDSASTLRAALVADGAPLTLTAVSAALAQRWIYHGGGGAAWTPMRFVIPVRDSTGDAQRNLVFIFDSGVGERGGISRRIVGAEVRRPAPDDE